MKKWSAIAEFLPGRSRKQCRERWLNQLDPSITKAPWTPQEDAQLQRLHAEHGNKWARIARELPGRCVLARGVAQCPPSVRFFRTGRRAAPPPRVRLHVAARRGWFI
jgi:hypothetical protein